MKRAPIPLTIAGSDPTAGAGIELDLLVFAQFALHGVAVATALTEQSTRRVVAANPVAPALLEKRLRTLLDDVPVAGVKLGLLPSARHVEVVAKVLRKYAPKHVVLDPVLAPTVGKPFLDRRGRQMLIEELLPIVTVLTPNLREAAELLGWSTPEQVDRDLELALAALQSLGPNAVLLKGGHRAAKTATDVLASGDTLEAFSLDRLTGARRDVHGTGCALSSAILAGLLNGNDLPDAVSLSKRFVHRAIANSVAIGRGRPRLDIALRPSALR